MSVNTPAPKQELLPCKEAFEAFLKDKSLSNEKSYDMLDQEIYKYHNIESMWYAWKECWTHAPLKSPAQDKGEIVGIIHGLMRFPVVLRKMWSGQEVQKWIDDRLRSAMEVDDLSPATQPPQEVLKAAVESMSICFKRLQNGVMAKTVHDPQNYCAATITESGIDEALAQLKPYVGGA